LHGVASDTCANGIHFEVNSVVIVNWEDVEFAQRVLFSLERQGYVRVEDYECGATHMQVWEKGAATNLKGRVIGSDPLAAIRTLPRELMVAAIKGRLAVYMPEGTAEWEVEHAATNLIFDLMGKPG
jgi:hypothetical protein